MARCRSNVFSPIVWSIATSPEVIWRKRTPADGHMTALKKPQSAGGNTNLRSPQDTDTA
jgi:hypothetical protein